MSKPANAVRHLALLQKPLWWGGCALGKRGNRCVGTLACRVQKQPEVSLSFEQGLD